jgi:para-nitrobenzyl esterase
VKRSDRQDLSATPSPIVETQHGKVRGTTVQGVHIFKGIPYGGPTEGAGRFLPPSTPDRWAGVYEATENGPRCVQSPGNIFLAPLIGAYFRGSEGRTELAAQEDSENCLVLNVSTPGLHGKRPVMVYIHGGGFASGSGLLTVYADALPREEDIVLVGVNHRLNVFGYLYLGGLSARYAIGNAGQLDLIAALEWVRDNIAHFGGDPGNVTLCGESGGGGKINTLMAMPAAKGLFHRAIIESGPLLRTQDPEAATAYARGLLSKRDLTESQVEELQSVPADELFALTRGDRSGAIRGPVVDGHSLPRQAWDLKAPEESASVPMMIGSCSHEGTIFAAWGSDQTAFNLDEGGLRSRLVQAGISDAEVDPLLALYHRDHPQDSPSDLYFRIGADRGIRTRLMTQVERKIEQGKANVYVYQFDWRTPAGEGKLKAFHTAGLPLAMRLALYPESERLSKQIAAAWAAFARTGNPSHPGIPEWPAYTADEQATMFWDVPQCQIVKTPDAEIRQILQMFPSDSLL